MSSFMDRMLGAARLEPAIYEEVEADTGAMGQAIAVVVLASLAAGVGALLHGDFSILILTTLGALFGWIIWAVLTWVIGTKLLPEPQTEADVGQLMRTIGFSAAPGILRIGGIIPVLGWLIVLVANIWMLVAMVVAVRQALDYSSTLRAVGVCLIGWVVQFLILAGLLAMAGVDSGI